MSSEPKRVTILGQSGLELAPLGVGTWQWGDRLWWGYGRQYGERDVTEAYAASRAARVTLFDTAEIYGFGRSERLLGACVGAAPGALVATKFFPFPWRWREQDLVAALQASLKRLALDRVDLYQIHWPLPPIPVEKWAAALARVHDLGMTRAVGVSNYERRDLDRAARLLEGAGVPLATNQIAYSLANRSAERSGVIQACRELGVTVIAYSPLAMGALSGKYSAEAPPPGLRRRRYSGQFMAVLAPLVNAMERIGRAHGGRPPSQVALNWVIAKGAIPIPGAKNAQQARDNAESLTWSLTEDEVLELDDVSDFVGRT